jgi:RimJ/RimL family protein N-acetyltransferase
VSGNPFEDENVVLQPLERDDVEALQVYLNDPDLANRRYIPRTFPQTTPLSRCRVEAILDEWEKREKAFVLGVGLRKTEELIGHAECNWRWDAHCPSVSVVVAPRHQRNGHGSAVLQMLLEYVFQNTPAHNVNAWIADWNHSALAFAERHGFSKAGRVPRVGIRDGAYVDSIVVDVLRCEWSAKGGG